MAWLVFMDESGHSHTELPYEVRGGYALADTHLWPFVQDVLRLELSCFGARLADYKSEVKGMKLLSKDRFEHAAQMPEIESRFCARIEKLKWKGEGYDGVRTYKSFGIVCVPDLSTRPGHEKGDNAFEFPPQQRSFHSLRKGHSQPSLQTHKSRE